MSDHHTVKAFDNELGQLDQYVAEMGGIAAKMVSDARVALSSVDSGLARSVVPTDPRLDALQRKIEEQAIAEIARRQPVAVDLRAIIGAIRIAGELERVGDLAKNIARRAIKIGPEALLTRTTAGLKHMTDLATELLAGVIEAYMMRDPARAHAIWTRDAEFDAAEDSIFRDLLTRMMEDPRNITSCAHLLFCSKNIERIGHHATAVARTVYFMVTGGEPRDGRD
jgi:phosphate transport system protein